MQYRDNSVITITDDKAVKPNKLRAIALVMVFFVLGAAIATFAMDAKMTRELSAMADTAQQQINQLAEQLAELEAQNAAAYLQNTSAQTLATSGNEDPVVAIAESCRPSIVGVTSMVRQQSYGGYNPFFPFYMPGQGNSGGSDQGSGDGADQEETYVEYSFGSGVVLTDDGYILTNHHVIEDADKVVVTLSDGSDVEAIVIGSDSYMDVALLKLTEDVSNLAPVTVGDSDAIKVGEMAVAIGNPLGKELFSTVTMGVISASDRQIEMDGRIIKTIQTDAAINSGNSGGGLFNSHGQLIGITTLKMSSSYADSASIEGLGFAIPINEVMLVVNQLMETGTVDRPTLGVTVSNSTDAGAEGIRVETVQIGSPAATAGLKKGDIITHFNGERITTSAELKSKLSYCNYGDTVTLTIIRDGGTADIKVELHAGSSM